MDIQTLKAVISTLPDLTDKELSELRRELLNICTVIGGELSKRELIGHQTAVMSDRKNTTSMVRSHSQPPAVSAEFRRDLVRR